MKKKWFKLADGKVQKLVEEAKDEDAELLRHIQENKEVDTISKDVLDSLKKRKIISSQVIRYFKVSKGAEYKPKYLELDSDLTYEMIKNYDELIKNQDGSTKTNEELSKQFKKYNWNADGKDM